MTDRPLSLRPLDGKQSQLSKTHPCPLLLSLSPSDLFLVDSPLLNHARTSPFSRSGKAPAPPSPDTRCIRTPPPLRQPGRRPTVRQGRSYPQNRSARSANPAVGHLEVWLAGCRERYVLSDPFAYRPLTPSAPGVELTMDVFSHHIYGPRRKTWGIEMTIVNSLARDASSHSHLFDIVS